MVAIIACCMMNSFKKSASAAKRVLFLIRYKPPACRSTNQKLKDHSRTACRYLALESAFAVIVATCLKNSSTSA